MDNKIKSGEYTHFKGKKYFVYCVAKDCFDNEFVFYKQESSPNKFWIRPYDMFTGKVYIDSKEQDRFKLTKKYKNVKNKFSELIESLMQSNILITHTELLSKYRILNLNYTKSTNELQVIVAPYLTSTSYLTDSQLAYKMGYDYYKINDKTYLNKSICPLPKNKMLYISKSNETDKVYEDKKIIDKMNPSSIDLHISDKFFAKAKRKTIDLATMLRFSNKADKLWKNISPKNINRKKGIKLYPGQTIATRTLEQIKLPDDCAGKMEIKSTYSRLALTVTATDFCNPGWEGYFPLTITNKGKHTIILHPGERMLQLILMPTDGQIINPYAKRATYMNDDGTPYKFWFAKTVKNAQKEKIFDKAIKLYQNVLDSITPNSFDDVEDTKKRFDDTFLAFCEKKIKKNDGLDERTMLNNIWDKYKSREKFLKIIFSKIAHIVTTITTFSIPTVSIFLDCWCDSTFQLKDFIKNLIIVSLSVAVEVYYLKISPKAFCTFEKFEFKKLYSHDEKK